MVLPTIHCEIYTMSDCGGFQTFWFLSLCANCYTDFPFLDYCFWLLLDFISSVIVYIHVPDNAIFITMSTFGLSCCGAGMLMYCVYCCFGASCTLWCEGLLIVHLVFCYPVRLLSLWHIDHIHSRYIVRATSRFKFACLISVDRWSCYDLSKTRNSECLLFYWNTHIHTNTLV